MFFRERQQITIFIIAVTMVGGFVLFRYVPLQQKMRTVKGAAFAQALAITRGQAEGKQLPLLKEHKLSLQQAVGNYDVSIPPQRALGGFLQRIAELMNEHNLREQVVTPGQEIKAGELNCIPVDMRCKGKLVNIFEFCKRIQLLDRLVRIEQVKLENDSDFTGEVSMQTKAVIYYRAEAAKG